MLKDIDIAVVARMNVHTHTTCSWLWSLVLSSRMYSLILEDPTSVSPPLVFSVNMPQSPLETYMLISVLKHFMLLTCTNPTWLFARSFSVLSSFFSLLCVSYRWHAISSRGMCRIPLADSMCINIIARAQGALLNVIVPMCTIVLPSAIGNLILRLKLDVF